MSSNLLPCPFCGSTNLRHEFSGSQSYIECNECGTQGPCDEWAADPICDQDAGCAAWNRRAADRAQPQPVPGEVQELVEWLYCLADKLTCNRRRGIRPHPSALTRAADLLAQRYPQPVPVSERLPGHIEQALIKAECALADIAEGEAEDSDGDPLEWAEKRAADALARIRPVMRQHQIQTSEWPPLPAHALPLPGEVEGC